MKKHYQLNIFETNQNLNRKDKLDQKIQELEFEINRQKNIVKSLMIRLKEKQLRYDTKNVIKEWEEKENERNI